ncbi:hypothetical protein H2198_008659 [Neophaeococcomyces mojaviensis]|uniref:Uncharacterized protein n=1 Tax=Neophaeococcomyces mojaviensis TaxID=3383035 RepID=A0ACC2ZWM5_9EURO|nr:hypothetical protein H2198_008659 [Knufia sp. JES_112]
MAFTNTAKAKPFERKKNGNSSDGTTQIMALKKMAVICVGLVSKLRAQRHADRNHGTQDFVASGDIELGRTLWPTIQGSLKKALAHVDPETYLFTPSRASGWKFID